MKKTKKKHPKKKILFLRKFTKFHSILTLGLFVFYLISSFIINPRFILLDTQSKFAQASSVAVSLRVAGQPGKPIASGSAVCTHGSAQINLIWNSTDDTSYYDIQRNSLPLITNLTQTAYSDIAVQKNTTYTYKMSANGIAGTVWSDSLTITAPNCPAVIPPKNKIQTMDGFSVASTDIIKTTSRQPLFTGTSNISNAQVAITLEGNLNIFANTTTNANGYWTWSMPVSLTDGAYTLYASITDPNEHKDAAIDHFSFEVYSLPSSIPAVSAEKKQNPNNTNSNQNKTTTPVANTETAISQPVAKPSAKPVDAAGQTASPSSGTNSDRQQPILPEKPTAVAPFNFGVEINNSHNVAYVGKDLEMTATIKNLDCSSQNTSIFYDVFDSQNSMVSSGQVKIDCQNKSTSMINAAIAKTIDQQLKITLPKNLQLGGYRIVLKIPDGENIVTTENSFEIKDVPLLTLSSGTEISTNSVLGYLSWVILALVFLLLIFLSALTFEHHLAQNALIQITENFLMKKGFIPKRKGVSK